MSHCVLTIQHFPTSISYFARKLAICRYYVVHAFISFRWKLRLVHTVYQVPSNESFLNHKEDNWEHMSFTRLLAMVHILISLKKQIFGYLYRFPQTVRIQAMVKASTLQAMKAHGGCGCKGPHIHITKKLERGMMVASPTVGSFTSGESTGTLFIVGGVDPRISLDTKERRKISNLRNPGSNPTHLARSQVPCRLSYLANAISL